MANETKTTGGVGLPPGTKIGKYEIRERLAIGGQAILYRAYDAMLDRAVVIKQISSHLATDPKFLERFRKEAQILARLGLRQPSIVTIFELVEDERGLFIVMEHLEGLTLETIFEQNPEPVEVKATLQILWRLAAALHDVHSAGIIHRDIKPANIIIDKGLRPKITDFGVAASLTGQTSMLLGTTKYMAPELLSGGSFDGRADMYSLGLITYEMLIGRTKFNEIFADVVRDKHTEALRWMKWHSNPAVTAPPAHEVNANVPASISAVVAKMMAKDPAGRYENMEQLGRAIKQEFSPRAKAAAVAAAPAHHHRKHHAPAAQPLPSAAGVAMPVATNATIAKLAAGSGLPADEGDQLVVHAGPATAPIPKRKMARRTKLVLLGAVVGVALLGIVFAMVRESSIQADAKARLARMFDEAYSEYKAANYDKAIEGLTDVRQTFKSGKYASGNPDYKASILLPLSEARQAIATSKWETASAKEADARKALDDIQRRAAADNTDLLDFTREISRDIESLASARTTAKKFWDDYKGATDAFDQGRREDALKALKGLEDGTITLTELQKRQVHELAQKIHEQESQLWVTEQLAAAQKAAKEDGPGAAEPLYKDLKAKLADDKDEKAAFLPREQRDKLIAQINSEVDALGQQKGLAKIMEEIDAARKAGDLVRELDRVSEAIKRASTPELERRKLDLMATLAFKAGSQFEGSRRYGEARDRYLNVLKILADRTDHFDVKDAATAALDRISKFESRDQLVAQGNSAFDNQRYPEALALYGRATTMPAAPKTDEENKAMADKIVQCKYKIALAEADALRDQKKFQEAMLKYQELKQINPAAGPVVDERMASLMKARNYDAALGEGDQALKDKSYSKAIDRYNAAAKIDNTEEVRNRIINARYQEYFARGKEALDGNDFKGAKANLELALKYCQESDRKMIEALIGKCNDGLAPKGE